jgi:hypothetical protein
MVLIADRLGFDFHEYSVLVINPSLVGRHATGLFLNFETFLF